MTDLKLSSLLKSAPPIAQHAGKHGVLMGTLVSMEANLRGFPFPGWSQAEDRQAVAQKLLDALRETKEFKRAYQVNLAELSKAQRYLMLERCQLTHAMAARHQGVYAIFSKDQSKECYINDEEHLLYQCFYGCKEAAAEGHAEMLRMRRYLSEKLDPAEDPALGMLMSDPSKTGDGFFLSYLLHLPGLRICKRMNQIINAFEELDIYCSSIFSAAMDVSDIFMIHSRVSPKGGFADTISLMQDTLSDLTKHELAARESLLRSAKNSRSILHEIDHAYRTLTSSATLRYREMLRSLSMLRLGLYYNSLQGDSVVSGEQIGLACVNLAPAHLRFHHHISPQNERMKFRADSIRALILDELHISPNPNFLLS